MDPDDDTHRHYKVPVPRGPALCIFLWEDGTFLWEDGTFLCPVCPDLVHRWRRLTEVRDHVLGQAKLQRP
jgi:hypothetical protein